MRWAVTTRFNAKHPSQLETSKRTVWTPDRTRVLKTMQMVYEPATQTLTATVVTPGDVPEDAVYQWEG